MSDYLNNIIARSLSVADVVQPRVPHLFEQSAAAMPADVAPAPVESAAEMMVGGEAQRSSYPPTPVLQINPDVTPTLLEQFRPAPFAQPVAPPPVPVLPEPSMPAPEMTSRNIEPAATNESAIRVRPVQASASVTEQRRSVSSKAPRVADAVIPSSVGPTPAEPSVAARRSEPAIPNQPNVSISHAPPNARPNSNRVEQQLPPIRINIGRVDVRAIMPAAQPVVPNSPRPKPALSLESYLKQREEGKR